MTMDNQYCRVGTITPLGKGQLAVTFLEYQYQNFMDKAGDIRYANTRMGEFFENKAQQVKKALENLVH